MKTVAEKIRELKEKEGQIKQMGGAKAVDFNRSGGMTMNALTRSGTNGP